MLQRLAESGVSIAIDQFDAGACSVAYLWRFPTDRTKIAQSFVRRAETLGGEAAVVRATIGLARELGIGVIAEGVENPEQTRMLAEWGCSEAHGFYFSKPLTADESSRAASRSRRTSSTPEASPSCGIVSLKRSGELSPPAHPRENEDPGS